MFKLSNWYISHKYLTTFVFAKLPFLLKLDKAKLSGVGFGGKQEWSDATQVVFYSDLIYILQYPVLGGENILIYLSAHWSSFADERKNSVFIVLPFVPLHHKHLYSCSVVARVFRVLDSICSNLANTHGKQKHEMPKSLFSTRSAEQ